MTVSFGAVLAGGRARRMGFKPKGLLERDGESIVARLTRIAARLTPSVALIGDPDGPYAGLGWPVVPDVIPGKGAPGGVHAALSHAPAPGWVLVLACDLPDIDEAQLGALLDPDAPFDALLYAADGFDQPLAAWWNTRALGPLETVLKAGNPGFRAVLSVVRHRVIPAQNPGAFRNLNRPEEAQAAGMGWGSVDL